MKGSIKLCTVAYNSISKLHYNYAFVFQFYFVHYCQIMENTTLVLPPSNTTQKPQSLEEILQKVGSITNVSYTPFQPEPKRIAQALLPTSFPPKPHPFDYFSLFFTYELFQTITANTNKYANIQRLHKGEASIREWALLVVEELYIFIDTIIYMGIHKEP